MANQKYKLQLSIALCVYAIVYTIGLPMVFGIQQSYSSYYSNSPMWFMLLTSVLAIGLWEFTSEGWTLPASALCAVALFNYEAWPIIHYVAAITFFVSATLLMLKDKRYKSYGRLSLAGYPLLIMICVGELFWFEAMQIIVIAAYHTRRVIHLIKLK